MLRPKNQSLVLAVVAFSAITCGIDSGQVQYIVSQSSALHRGTKATGGELQVLTDGRLSSAVRDELWGKGAWSFVLSPRTKLFQEFSKMPPGNAKLQIRDEGNDLLSERLLGAPLAELQEMHIDGESDDTFLLTVDHSAGFGSYSGLVTTLLQIHGTKFRDLEAQVVGTRSHEPIRVVKSLKADWKMFPGSREPEILSISCRPGQDNSFVIVYVRYYLHRGAWFKRQRIRPGLWESDRAFPPQSAFP
jgi:hypothetical protein